MTLTNHNPNIEINISLSAPPGAEPNFQIPILFVPLATNSLDGDVVRSYGSVTDIADDLTASYISATTAAQLTAMFQQLRPSPEIVKAASVDLVGSVTYGTALAAARAVDPEFYFVAIQPRTQAEIVLMSNAVEAEKKSLFMFQDDDGDWLTSGVPATIAPIIANERTSGVYHDEDTEPLAEAAIAMGMGFSPDEKSAPFTMTITGVDSYTAALTAGQRAFALANNINVMGEFGSVETWLDKGTNLQGREIRHLVTRDWLDFRIRQRVSDMIITRSNRGDVLPVTREGQVLVMSILSSLIDEGVAAGHFKLDQFVPIFPTITPTDISNRRVRVTGNATLLVGGRLVTYTINLDTADVIAAA